MEHVVYFKEEIELLFAFPTICANDSYVFVSDHFTAFEHHIGNASTKASLASDEFINGVETLNIDGVVGISPGKLGPNGLGAGGFFSPGPKGEEHQGDGDNKEGRCHLGAP